MFARISSKTDTFRIAAKVKVLFAIVLCFSLAACQTNNLSNVLMTQDVQAGVPEGRVREAKGQPHEIQKMSGGERKLSYFYQVKNIKKGAWGKVKETLSGAERLDIWIGLSGNVERFETSSDPALDPALELFKRANAANTKGDLNTALDLLNKLLAERPYHAMARQIRASVYERLENKGAAVADYQFLVENDPGNAITQHNLGISYFDQGDLERSIDSFDQALRAEPHSAMSYAYRARTLAKAGQRDRAEEDIAAAKKNGFVFSGKLVKEFESLGLSL